MSSRHVPQEERVSALVGSAGALEYRDMVRTNPECTAAHDAIIEPLATASWSFVPQSEDERAQVIADQVNALVEGMERRPFRAVIREASSTSLINGHSTWEPIWRGSKLVDIAPRPPETISEMLADEHGHFTGVLQTNGARLLRSEGRCIHLVRARRGADMRGVSAFRGAWRPFKMGEQVEQIATISAERNSAGVPVAKLGKNSTGSDVTALRKEIDDVYVNEQLGLIIPHWVEEFDFKGTQGAIFPVLELLKRFDQQILRALGVEFLAIGLTDTGSYAARTDASSELIARLVSHACVVVDAFQADFVPWAVMAVTGRADVPRDLWPRLEHDGLDVSNFTEVGAFVSMMHDKGIIQLSPEDVVWLRGLANMPALSSDQVAALPDEILPKPTAPAQAPTGFNAKGGCCGPSAATFLLSDASGRPFTARREMTLAERRVEFVALKGALDGALGVTEIVSRIRGKMMDALLAELEQLLREPESASLEDVAEIRIPESLVEDMADPVFDALSGLYREGRASVIEETARGADVPSDITDVAANLRAGTGAICAALRRPEAGDEDAVARHLDDLSKLTSRSIASRLFGTFEHAVRDALGVPGGAGSILDFVRQRFAELTDAGIEDEVRQASADALNTGRQASFEEVEAQVSRFQLSELIESATICQPCVEVDEETFDSMAELIAADRMPPQSVCEGRSRCRGIVVGVLRSEGSAKQ